MSDSKPDWAALVPELYAEPRNDEPPPTLEEILSHLAGELSDDEENDFLDRLALHPEAARLAADLAMPEGAKVDDAELVVPDMESVRASLRARGVLPEPTTTQAPAPETREKVAAEVASETTNVAEFSGQRQSKSKMIGVHPAWQWAACLLVAVNLGLWWQPSTMPQLGGPSVDVATWVLESEHRIRRSGRTELSVDAAAARWHVMELILADRGDHAHFQIVLADVLGTELWRDEITPSPTGTFNARIPAEFLSGGRYQFQLIGIDGKQEVELAVYPFAWKGK